MAGIIVVTNDLLERNMSVMNNFTAVPESNLIDSHRKKITTPLTISPVCGLFRLGNQKYIMWTTAQSDPSLEQFILITLPFNIPFITRNKSPISSKSAKQFLIFIEKTLFSRIFDTMYLKNIKDRCSYELFVLK